MFPSYGEFTNLVKMLVCFLLGSETSKSKKYDIDNYKGPPLVLLKNLPSPF